MKYCTEQMKVTKYLQHLQFVFAFNDVLGGYIINAKTNGLVCMHRRVNVSSILVVKAELEEPCTLMGKQCYKK
jgi:hypothetical protein